MNGKQIWYLAHPYSAKTREEINDNVRKSITITNKLLDLGYCVFNPLTHSHPLDLEQKRPSGFWYEYDLKLMDMCSGIILCGDHEKSKGCRLGRFEANKRGLDVKYLEEIL